MEKTELYQLAKGLGAVAVRIYFIRSRQHSVNISIPFSHHFFNEDDIEICYYIDDLANRSDMDAMFIFDQPRIWSEEFKNNEVYTFSNLQ